MIGATTKTGNDDKPSPCRRCIHSERCATKELACIDFFRYVLLDDQWPNSKVRSPSKGYYNKVYRMPSKHEHIASNDSETSGEIAAIDGTNG